MLTFAALMALAALLTSRHVDASSSAMPVQVRVLSRLSIVQVSGPTVLHVEAADLARGYIDVPQAVVFHVQSNLNEPYTVEFHSDTPLVRRVEVLGSLLPPPLSASPSGVLIPSLQGDHVYRIQVRVHLDPAMPLGRHPWSIHLAGSG